MAVTKHKTHSKMAKLSELIQTEEGYATSFDGTKIWYRSVGSGHPIVCCNGLGCSTFYFHYIENYFKRHYRVITFDYRGHGKSENPAKKENHTIESLVADLKCVFDALGVKKATLVGHSMGVQILFEFYSRYKQYCDALIPCFGTFAKPIDTFMDFPASKYVFEVIYHFNHTFPKIAKLLGRLMMKNPLWFQVGGALNVMKPYLVDKKIMEQYIDHIINVDPVFLSSLTKSLQHHDAEDSLKKITVPTLIMGAEDDNFTPLWVSKKMHHLIPRSELFIVKKGSHVALVEQPELINLRIEKFLEERLGKKSSPRRQKINQIVKKRITQAIKKNKK
ncbi:alpha/beta hydrolase [bacterium]|nr:alpha/beta hydrolase [bacterium]